MSKNVNISQIVTLARKLGRVELLHFEVESALKSYSHPNKKIHDLIASGLLQKIQRGVYRVSSDLIEGIPPSQEILAQLIYGPSYISLEWSLSHYGLIPEQVRVVTSVTVAKKKKIVTVDGVFEYQHLPLKKYLFGYFEQSDFKNTYLLASPLKSLIDLIYFREDKNQDFTKSELSKLFEFHYRLDLLSFYTKTSLEEILTAKKLYRRVNSVSQALDFFIQNGDFK